MYTYQIADPSITKKYKRLIKYSYDWIKGINVIYDY